MATTFTVAALLGGSAAVAGTASGAPPDKCQKNPENFQMVNGRCVSDGKAEKEGDTGKDETRG